MTNQFKTIQLSVTGETVSGKSINLSTTSPRMVKYVAKALQRQGVQGEFPVAVELPLYMDDDGVLQFAYHDSTKWSDASARVLAFSITALNVDEIDNPSADDSWID